MNYSKSDKKKKKVSQQRDITIERITIEGSHFKKKKKKKKEEK
jgi:hypothetical protein